MTNSLAKRLTFRIMAVVVVMMVIITGIVNYTVREYMLDEAKVRYEGVLMRDHEEFRRRLSVVRVAMENNVYDIEHEINDRRSIFQHVERIVRENSSIFRCGVWYEKDYFYPKNIDIQGCHFAIYASRDSTGEVFSTGIITKEDYFQNKDWFKRGLEKNSAGWSGVYYEHELPDSLIRNAQVVTYYIPIHNEEGRPIAMFCSDFSLELLRAEIMEDIQEMNEKLERGLKHHSYSFVIDKEGNYLMHPDEDRILNGNFIVESKNTSNTTDDRVMESMMKGEQGTAMMEIDGVPSWIYYRTVKHRDWVIAIVVPKEVIFHNGRMLNAIILFIVLLGLLALYFINRHLIKEITSPVTAQKAAIDRELKIAHDIQMAMLPTMPPKFGDNSNIHTDPQPPNLGSLGVDIYASETPAREVGGDLFDYFLRENRLFFCIGDVSGKGMPAALMMAVMRAMFRSETRRADNAAAIVDTMNHNLSEEYTAGYFVTMFVGILDLNTGHLDYCNAGHEAPLVSGKPLSIKPNLPVGALPEWNYEGQQAQLKSGDMLFLYTDGLSEAKNYDGQQLGRQHVIRIASQHVGDTVQQMVQLMEEEVHHHVAGADQSDDITLLAIKWNPTKLILHASMEEMERLQPFVEAISKQAGIDNKESKRLRLALEEAVVNVINYGQATTITLQASVKDGQLQLTIDDDGQPFDPTADSTTDLSIPPDQRPPGGMGIILLHKMTDGQNYQRKDGHNILTLIKKIKV